MQTNYKEIFFIFLNLNTRRKVLLSSYFVFKKKKNKKEKSKTGISAVVFSTTLSKL